MGLFGLSKKEEKKSELPPLQFPELPKSVPTFQPQKAVGLGEAHSIKSAVASPMPAMAAPALPSSLGESEKPLFVKIEKYRDVVDTLRKLKSRLNDADSILNKLHHLKDQEERELQGWQSDLEKIRNQLLDIDKKLFE